MILAGPVNDARGSTGKGNTDAWIAQNTLSKRALRLTIDVIYNIRIKIMSLILKQ